MKKRTNIMNQNFKNYENIRFKNWIKRRFISEVDICNISYKEALLWCEALEELSKELIDTWSIFHHHTHEIVPFHRRKG